MLIFVSSVCLKVRMFVKRVFVLSLGFLNSTEWFLSLKLDITCFKNHGKQTVGRFIFFKELGGKIELFRTGRSWDNK